MPIFHPPVYSKHTDTKKGSIETCYTFSIEFSMDDQCISFIANDVGDISESAARAIISENNEWITQFIQQFMQASSKLFAKPYTVEQINKITKHLYKEFVYDQSFPATITLVPTTIKILSGIFWVQWDYRCKPIMIDIPVLFETEPTTTAINTLPDQAVSENVEELNLDDLTIDGNATDDSFDLNHSDRFYDKQKVKEARLKAKLAQYKAERQMRMYYDKYGNEMSDTDVDDSSDESSDGSSDEEVQL
jgi:hypothetical protein